MPANTLYEYYTQQNKPLVSVGQRFNDPAFAAAATAAGVSKDSYTGSAAQNNAILRSLQGGAGNLQGTLPPADRSGGAADPTQIPGGTPGPADTGLNVGQTNVSDLGNFRVALRTALEEAGKTRMGTLNNLLGGLNINTPGTIGAISDLLRGSVKPSVEAIFSDYYKAYETASEYKKKELDRILELRLEFGSAIPDNVTTLAEAMKYVTPLIDQERDLDRKERLAKLAEEQSTDNDIEGYARCMSLGASAAECGVPTHLRSTVTVRANELAQDLLDEDFSNEQQFVKDRIDAGRTTYDQAREEAWSISDPVQRREMLDYIDSLEKEEKDRKKQKKIASQPNYLYSDTAQSTPAAVLPKDKTAPDALTKGGSPSNFQFNPNPGPFDDLFSGFNSNI